MKAALVPRAISVFMSAGAVLQALPGGGIELRAGPDLHRQRHGEHRDQDLLDAEVALQEVEALFQAGDHQGHSGDRRDDPLAFQQRLLASLLQGLAVFDLVSLLRERVAGCLRGRAQRRHVDDAGQEGHGGAGRREVHAGAGDARLLAQQQLERACVAGRRQPFDVEHGAVAPGS